MKKYFQSTAYVIFVIVTFLALVKAFSVYENPFSLYENPLVWVALIGFFLVIILKEVVNVFSHKRATELQMEKDGISPEEVDNWAWFKELMKRWTKSKAIEEEGEIILDHNYDGIRELDNSLPPWWLYLFYGTILFAAVYLVRYHILGADNQVTEYNKKVAEAQVALEKYKSTATDIIDLENVTLLTDQPSLSRGKAIFDLNCSACHMIDGGGGIGPNLTDKYWILGGGIKNVFKTITEGGRPGKGMVPWGKTIKPNDIQKVASYLLTLQGTTPANPKDPQGEIIWEKGDAVE